MVVFRWTKFYKDPWANLTMLRNKHTMAQTTTHGRTTTQLGRLACWPCFLKLYSALQESIRMLCQDRWCSILCTGNTTEAGIGMEPLAFARMLKPFARCRTPTFARLLIHSLA